MYMLHVKDVEAMATRTVALDDEAYGLLKAQKRAQESFSETVKRLARRRKPITAFAGIWSDLSSKERRELDRVYGEMKEADARRSGRLRSMWE
jgi:predicted CopG family antitoxin